MHISNRPPVILAAVLIAATCAVFASPIDDPNQIFSGTKDISLPNGSTVSVFIEASDTGEVSAGALYEVVRLSLDDAKRNAQAIKDAVALELQPRELARIVVHAKQTDEIDIVSCYLRRSDDWQPTCIEL